MEKRANPNHPVFKSLPGLSDNIRKAFGYPNEKSLNEAVDQLHEWVQKQNHFAVKNIARDYLEAYLITAKGSIEKAKQRLEKRFTLPGLMPELFKNIDLDNEFSNLKKVYQHACMPIPAEDGYRVTVDRFKSEEVDAFNMIDWGRYLFVNAEFKMMNDYVMGYEGVIDFRGITVATIMSKINLIILRKCMVTIVEGYGGKIKAVHIISESKFIDTIVGLLKQGMSEKMVKRIQVHTSHETLAKFIPKDQLPSDYGGTLTSMDELDNIYFQTVSSKSHKAWMKVAETFVTDETKRLSDKYNEDCMGLPGSFRTLNVD